MIRHTLEFSNQIAAHHMPLALLKFFHRYKFELCLPFFTMLSNTKRTNL